jgi:hypothetical protein
MVKLKKLTPHSANMDDLLNQYGFFSDLSEGSVCEDIPCQNLAVPPTSFGGFSHWWRNGGEFLQAIFHCKPLRIGAVWNDWQLRFGEDFHPTWVREPSFEMTCCYRKVEMKQWEIIEKEWEACEELQKRKETLPKLGALGLDGSWVKRE